MPIITSATTAPPQIGGLVAAAPGWRVSVLAPAGSDVGGVPAPTDVVGWVLVPDPERVGGARVDPVFLAGGQTWTPDQYRAAYGQHLTVRVGRAA